RDIHPNPKFVTQLSVLISGRTTTSIARRESSRGLRFRARGSIHRGLPWPSKRGSDTALTPRWGDLLSTTRCHIERDCGRTADLCSPVKGCFPVTTCQFVASKSRPP